MLYSENPLANQKEMNRSNRIHSFTRVNIVNPLVSNCSCPSLRNARRPLRDESTAIKEKTTHSIPSIKHLRATFIV